MTQFFKLSWAGFLMNPTVEEIKGSGTEETFEKLREPEGVVGSIREP